MIDLNNEIIQEDIIDSLSIDNDTDFFVNNSGAVVFKDESKQPILEIPEDYIIKTVLSIGFNHAHKPMATIQEDDGNVICYILPDDYLDWCKNCIGMSMIGMNFFPSDVVFSLDNGKYSVIMF